MAPHISFVEQILQGIIGALLSVLVQPPRRKSAGWQMTADVAKRISIGGLSAYLLAGIAVDWAHDYLPPKVVANPVQMETAINGAVGFAGWWIAGMAAAVLTKFTRNASSLSLPQFKKDNRDE